MGFALIPRAVLRNRRYAMMILHLRLLLLTVLRSASVGVVAGLAVAAREVSAQHYLPQHLWRTALWIACHDTALGALVGAAGGAVMIVSLAGWQAALAMARRRSGEARPEPMGGATSQSCGRLAVFFAACTAAACLLMPVEAPETFGVSHWFAVAACVALVWVIASRSAVGAPRAPERDASLFQFGLRWAVVVSLAYLVALAHLWARAWADWATASAAGVGLMAALVIYYVPDRPVRLLSERLGSAVPAALGIGLRWAPVAIMTCVAVLWAAGWSVGMRARSRAAAAGTNIIIIAVDTLRSDATSLLSADEHERDCTPNIRQALASRSTVFSTAYSQAPWTLPAFSSIFTGLYPEEHGAEHVWSRLGPEQITLAEILREHGYQTMAVVSGHYVTSEVGTLQGFSAYDESMVLGGWLVTSGGVTDSALRYLEGVKRDRPFFLFVHYFDPHYPYFSHREVDLGEGRADEPAPTEGSRREGRSLRRAGTGAGMGLGPTKSRATYDEEVAYVDLHIGRLLALLEERRLWEDTCVVFVADHGEEFWDHGATGHDNTLFDELVRVPLSLTAPSLDLPKVVSDPVETRWLFGTLLEIAGLRPTADAADDPSLLAPGEGPEPYMRSSTCPRGRTGVEGSTKPSVWLSCLTGRQYKLIEDHLNGRTMLFDLPEDPRELRNLSQEQTETTDLLRQALAARDATLLGTGAAGPATQISEAETRRLKSLGYL
jgi:arylsulfatase A-like enzyme